ncbi:hypothetical protein ACM9HF_02340 [Colwellia sp. RE-S-Sl-9]
MKIINLFGAKFSIDDKALNFIEPALESNKTDYCNGNACDDIYWEWDDDTRSYHFFNEGEKRVRLKVEGANYLGCNGVIKRKTMRPGTEWECKLGGICEFSAKYTD